MKRILFSSLAVAAGFVGIIGLSSFIGAESTTLKAPVEYYFNDSTTGTNPWQSASNYNAPEPAGGCPSGNEICRITLDSSEDLQSYLNEFSSANELMQDTEHVSTKN